jgi:ribose transport system ATP-binding protein
MRQGRAVAVLDGDEINETAVVRAVMGTRERMDENA